MSVAAVAAALGLGVLVARPGARSVVDSASARAPSGSTGARAPLTSGSTTGVQKVAVAGATTGVKPASIAGATPPATGTKTAPRAVAGPPSKCPAKPKTFSVLLDAVRPLKQGSKLNFSYDVCGLDQNSPLSTDITVSRTNQPRFRGKTNPVTLHVLDVAATNRFRRRRQIDITSLPPGQYAIDVIITDRQNRQQTARREFEILEKK